ncbi:MAG: ribosome recycling factor [Pseudomonadota bacterium]
MSDDTIDIDDLERRMSGAVSVLKTEFGGLRTGRASASLLDPIVANAYGAPTPINQLATISVPEPRIISVQIWDKSNAAAVEKAIRESDLGLNPVVDGQLLRIPLPELNEERRNEMVKVAHKYAEGARVAVRHVRRDGMDKLKRLEKDGNISQDEQRDYADLVQSLTDSAITEIDEVLAGKEQEILTV